MTEVSAGEQAPTLLRRHAAGTDSARSVLFTVLGELVLPTGGEAWTSAFIDLFGRLGVEEKAARQALMRTAADNWLTSERVGRRTVWRLTPTAERLLRDGTERIFGFTAVAADWDGRWMIVIARTPETERAARHMLRTRLRWTGFGSVMPGVWLGPRSDRGDEVRQILDEAGLPDGYLFTAEYQGGGSLDAMVRHAWDLDELARAYDEFIEEFSGTASPDPLTGSSTSYTPGGGSRGSIRASRLSSCPCRGAAPPPPSSSPGCTRSGPMTRSPSGSSCWPGLDRPSVQAGPEGGYPLDGGVEGGRAELPAFQRTGQGRDHSLPLGDILRGAQQEIHPGPGGEHGTLSVAAERGQRAGLDRVGDGHALVAEPAA